MDWFELAIQLAIVITAGLGIYLIAELLPIQRDFKRHIRAVMFRWLTMMLPFLIILALGKIAAFLFVLITMQRACLEYTRRLLMPHDFTKFLTITAALSFIYSTLFPNKFILLPHILLLVAMAFAIWRIRFENSWSDIAQCLLACVWLILPISTFILIAQLPNGTNKLIVLGLGVSTANFCSEFIRMVGMQALHVPMQSHLGKPRARWRIRACELAGCLGSIAGAIFLLKGLLFIIPQMDWSEGLIMGTIMGVTSFLGAASLRLFVHVTEQTDPLFLKTQRMVILDKIAPFIFTNITAYFIYTITT